MLAREQLPVELSVEALIKPLFHARELLRREYRPGFLQELLRGGVDHLVVPIRVQCDFPSLPWPDPLTARELEILRFMARGCSNPEIGDALAITEGTVKNYVSSILSKMGCAIGPGPC